MGSSDRRWATRHAYAFFRLGKTCLYLPLPERLALADFLCHSEPGLVVKHYLPDLVSAMALPLSKKLPLVMAAYPAFNLQEVFSWGASLSEGLAFSAFASNFFIQPALFIRVKEEAMSKVKRQLEMAHIAYKEMSATALALPNGTKLEAIEALRGRYQVQDWSSQQTGAYFVPQRYDYWWDCCAASGGKSLLLHALQPDIQLLVTDIRESSLQNLRQRFQDAGITKYQAKSLDLLQNNMAVLHDYLFDGILLDAPCSGSGTWGRTPEMLYYFNADKIAGYAHLQKAIATNVAPHLKSGKPLIYMTCSVFKAENEEVVQYICENLPLKLEKMALIKGYDKQADSMFVARFIKE